MGFRSMTISDTVTLVTEECCACNCIFAMTEEMQDRRLRDHKSFYCPNGHSQSYTGKTEEQKLREQLDAEKRRTESERIRTQQARDQAAAAERAARAYKGQATKIRRRVLRGVCPFCNRSFENVQRHMSTQHADRLDEEGVHLEHGDAES